MRAAGLLAAVLLCAARLAWGAQPQDGLSVFLPYVGGPRGDEAISAPPHLMLSFGGAARRAVMDTGSTGIVVSAGAIPGEASLPGEAGTLTYSSSGRIMIGRWVRAAAAISGADGRTVHTQPIPVLAVQRTECLPHARACVPGSGRGVAMIGIGFGREGDHQARSTPDHNPFLNLDHPAWRGWIVQRTGVRVGLTSSAVSGFATVALGRSPVSPDWNQARGCVTVGRDATPACGTVLMDTGVSRMFLAVPPDRVVSLGGATLRTGTQVRIAIPDATAPRAGYGFAAGDRANPLAPESVVLVPRPTPFVNTSVRFLNGFDVMFDADRGLVGYRRAQPSPRFDAAFFVR